MLNLWKFLFVVHFLFLVKEFHLWAFHIIWWIIISIKFLFQVGILKFSLIIMTKKRAHLFLIVNLLRILSLLNFYFLSSSNFKFLLRWLLGNLIVNLRYIHHQILPFWVMNQQIIILFCYICCHDHLCGLSFHLVKIWFHIRRF